MKTLKHGLILFGLFCAVFLIAEYALSADINGQLKKAQLEQLGSDPTASTSRIYYNTGDATFRYYNGAWRTIVDTSTALAATRNINTTSPLTGGGNLTADRTIAIPVATTSANGYLSSTDWTTFNGKVVTPAFTAGSVPFATGANTLSQDNSNFFWDSANARLGIGTSTFFNAAAKLEVSSGSDVRFALSDTANGNASFWLRTNGTEQFVFNSNTSATDATTISSTPLRFGTGNTVAMTVDTSQKVGVGTQTPTSLFSVGGSSQFQVNSTGNVVKINNVATSFPASQGAANTAFLNDGSGNMSWGLIADANVSGSAAISGSKLVSAASGVTGVVNTTTQTLTGAKTFETAGGKMHGVTDGSAATAGYIGERFISVVSSSATTPSAGTFTNVTSITPTAGSYLIWGTINVTRVSGQTSFEIAVSVNSGNTTSDHQLGYNWSKISNSTVNDMPLTVGPFTVDFTGNVPYYVKFKYDSGTQASGNVAGSIIAVRIR